MNINTILFLHSSVPDTNVLILYKKDNVDVIKTDNIDISTITSNITNYGFMYHTNKFFPFNNEDEQTTYFSYDMTGIFNEMNKNENIHVHIITCYFNRDYLETIYDNITFHSSTDNFTSNWKLEEPNGIDVRNIYFNELPESWSFLDLDCSIQKINDNTCQLIENVTVHRNIMYFNLLSLFYEYNNTIYFDGNDKLITINDSNEYNGLFLISKDKHYIFNNVKIYIQNINTEMYNKNIIGHTFYINTLEIKYNIKLMNAKHKTILNKDILDIMII